ncbi:MAG: hypothetical protein J6C77_05045 [Muribaculaceae bacterium]|nr:hypothetical protein [Muribaculaceae bacterium]
MSFLKLKILFYLSKITIEMKKLLLSLAVVMSVSMFACGGGDAAKTDADTCKADSCCQDTAAAVVDTVAADTVAADTVAADSVKA